MCCDTAAVFFFIAAFLVWCDKKFAGANYNNEQFNVSNSFILCILPSLAACQWSLHNLLLMSLSRIICHRFEASAIT